MRQLERTLGQKDLQLVELETRLQEAELSTFDGIFIWKIPEFAKKRQDAIVGRCPAMFSPRESLLTAWWHYVGHKTVYLTEIIDLNKCVGGT